MVEITTRHKVSSIFFSSVLSLGLVLVSAALLSPFMREVKDALVEDTYGLEESVVKSVFTSEYTIDTKNNAEVTIGIAFTNEGDVPTALRTYDLSVGDMLPKNITAKHGEESLTTDLLESRGSVIRINLGDELLRVDDTYEVQIGYTVDQFLVETSGGYSVEFPIFEQTEHSSITSVMFTYPEAFGPTNYATEQFKELLEEKQYTLTFANVAEVGRMYIAIGERTNYSVLMERELENDEDVYVKKELLIPPDFGTQEFVITSISPYPGDVFYTSDGNYILSYDIPSGETVTMRVQGILIEKLRQGVGFYLSQVKETHFLDTEPDWWRIIDEDILAEIESLEGKSDEEKIDWVYDYTMEELVLSDGFRQLHGSEYRKGASVALKTYKNASVEDYSDVFVGLARTAGVPSRVVSGYVFPYSVGAKKLGMFHVWPQYWSDEEGWVSVDPAYEVYAGLEQRQTVGLNRVVVAVSYDVEVFGAFADTTDEITMTNVSKEPVAAMNVSVEVADEVGAVSTSHGTLTIENEGNVILHGVSFVPSEENQLEIKIDQTTARTVVLPGETIDIAFTIQPLEWYVTGDQDLSFIVVAESAEGTQRTTVEEKISVTSLWWVEPLSWFITLVAFLICAGIVFIVFKIGIKIFRKGQKTKNNLGETQKKW